MVDAPPADPYEGVSPLLDLAAKWVARAGAGHTSLTLAVYDLRWRGDWRLSIHRNGKEIEGVSVVMPDGQWLIDASTVLAASALANTAVIHDRRPKTLTTSARVADWLRDLLEQHRAIAAERTLRVLACTKPVSTHAGRWATTDDLRALAAYEKLIDTEPNQTMDTSWPGLVARKELAIADSADGIVASARRYGPAPSSAGLADLYVVPSARRTHVGSSLAGFVVNDLLVHRQTVYAAVDDADAASLALHAAVGFVDVGTCYRALLQ
jgi:hypothetical protein